MRNSDHSWKARGGGQGRRRACVRRVSIILRTRGSVQQGVPYFAPTTSLSGNGRWGQDFESLTFPRSHLPPRGHAHHVLTDGGQLEQRARTLFALPAAGELDE